MEPYCDYIQYKKLVFYASQDRMEIFQKPVGVCHTDATISGIGTSIIFNCLFDGGVEIEYWNNQLCEGDPVKTETLDELMDNIGWFCI